MLLGQVMAARGSPGPDASSVERAILALEQSRDLLFAAGRYREFFEWAHALRQHLRDARLPRDRHQPLWVRLHACTDAAKARQAADFAQRATDSLARWRAQIAVAERYADNLLQEIAEYEARGGSALERSRWQRRAAEKRERLVQVRANLTDLRRKLADAQGAAQTRALDSR